MAAKRVTTTTLLLALQYKKPPVSLTILFLIHHISQTPAAMSVLPAMIQRPGTLSMLATQTRATSSVMKANATQVTTTPQVSGTNWDPTPINVSRLPRQGIFKKAVSGFNRKMPVVLDKLHEASKTMVFCARVFFGDFPDFCPQVIQTQEYAASTVSTVSSDTLVLDKNHTETDFTGAFLPESSADQPHGISTLLSGDLALVRLISRPPANRVTSVLANLETNLDHDELPPKASHVAFHTTAQVTTFHKEDPANLVPQVCAPAAVESNLREPQSFTDTKQVSYSKVNLVFYNKLVLNSFQAIGNGETSHVSVVAHRLRMLYGFLEKQMLDKVQANFAAEGRTHQALSSRLSALFARLRGLFMELDLLNELYQDGASLAVQPRLNVLVSNIHQAQRELDIFISDLHASSFNGRLLELLADIRECSRIGAMVSKHHFDLTDKVADSQGILFGDCGQLSFRRALSVVEGLLPRVNEVFLTDRKHRLLACASRTSVLVDSLLADAEQLEALL